MLHVLREAIGCGSRLLGKKGVLGRKNYLKSFVNTWAQCIKIGFGWNVWFSSLFFVLRFGCRQFFYKNQRQCIKRGNENRHRISIGCRFLQYKRYGVGLKDYFLAAGPHRKKIQNRFFLQPAGTDNYYTCGW